ncbi:MAG: amidohydrolase [Deltaproteobacteria bacterium]|nr:amidohydrolase [Deltaproteobacteria bacterium]
MASIDKADLVLQNGKIVTLNPNDDIVEAVAVKDGIIMAAGPARDLKALVAQGSAVIDLEGKTVTPGFVESHCHPSMAGLNLCFEVDVKPAASIDDIIVLLQQKAAQLPKANWVKGFGYNDQRLKEKRHPTRQDLDQATTDHPIFLGRTDGHLAVANSAALSLAGITKDTADPGGGRLDRDPQTGEPTGVLRELAQTMVKTLIPPYTVADFKEGILAACQQLAGWGITSFHDAAVGREAMIAYQELLAEKRLPLRVGMMIPGIPLLEFPGYLDELKTLGIQAGFGNERLRIYGTKFMCDGSMSGWTAALYEPYANEPDELGITVVPEDELTAGIVEAHRAGLRPVTHAIGDRAIDIVLDAIELALKERPDPDHRMSVEHCSLPTEQAIERMKQLGVLPSSSVGFIYELGPAHLLGLGPERIKGYFPHKTYLEKGIISVGNSDWFVTSADIAQQIYGVVTRTSYTGEVVGGEQAIPVNEALRLYTINGAYASFEENIKGSIEPGKLADMAVLDRDILSIPAGEIKDMQVEMTIVGGEIVFQRD